eukprot:6025947-Amphidinium_carterae.2
MEVMLDVVFNHTAEGTWGEHNWHSWAQIAKPHYYILSRGCVMHTARVTQKVRDVRAQQFQ